jgi:hypothetical protein
MQFVPAIHTKEFLRRNTRVALNLAKNSSEFAKSDLANDFTILNLRDDDGWGWSVAHALAEHQPEWINTEAANNLDVLQLKTCSDLSVAHWLATHQPKWVNSEAAKTTSILMLRDFIGESVAHELAKNQSEWIHSEHVMDKNILLLINNHGQSVAEYICEKHSESHGITTEVMIMRLISQGAAYKHLKPLDITVGESVLMQAKQLIEDCLEPTIALKFAVAFYSTCFYSVEKIKSTPNSTHLAEWQNILLSAENAMIDIAQSNSYVFDAEIQADILCEPGVEALNRFKAQKFLNGINAAVISLNESGNELPPKSGLY